MTVHEIYATFANEGKIVQQNGRAFTTFKKTGERRNTLFELNLSTWTLTPIGYMPGPYYIEGLCDLTFDPAGQLLMLNFCSASSTTGGEARGFVWETGINVGPVAAGASDGLVRSCLRAVRNALVPLG